MNSRRSIRAALTRMYLGDAFQLGVIVAIVVFALFAGNGHIPAGQITAAERIRTLLWYGLVAGLASMATIEVAKRLFGLRSHYQRLQVMAWLRSRTPEPASLPAGPAAKPVAAGAAGPSEPAAGTTGQPSTPGHAQATAVAGLAAPDELLAAMGLDQKSSYLQRRWLFDLPIDQLVAQISAAVDIALADPARYQALIDCVSGEQAPAGAATPGQVKVPASTPAVAGQATGARSKDAPGQGLSPSKEQQAAESDFRRSQRVRSGLDQMQISVGGRWRRYVQGTALWLSGLYGIVLVFITRAPSSARPEYIIGALLIGGVLSWVARDITAVIERWRG